MDVRQILDTSNPSWAHQRRNWVGNVHPVGRTIEEVSICKINMYTRRDRNNTLKTQHSVNFTPKARQRDILTPIFKQSFP